MKVSVFGGSAPQPGQPAYLEAQQLGELLGKAGHVVVTGGYVGVMEAVSRGASEAGAHVIGVTCQEIEDWRPICANRWVSEIRCEKTLFDRLNVLIRESDAWMALPGGPGTLVEISLVWNLLIIHAVPSRPLILVGQSWKRVMDIFKKEHALYLPESGEQQLIFADSAKQAITLLNR
ncbi:MAG: LOG family protein [Anaerolineaceae bacterium]|nr:LOG family protein [Anaerolineaceae bacterium]MBN2676616.1 LOG family protein [Anaerolineaceae bacterium]